MKVDHICKNCGKHQDGDWSDGQELADKQLCRTCHFWFEKMEIKDDPRTARIEGTHYYIGEKVESPAKFQGFGGAYFKIKFHDGREVETNNLWTQGKIPPAFADRLPDNAEFIHATR